MRRVRLARGTFGLFLGLASAGCEGLPEVDPSAFACTDDAPLEGGLFPCGESHWCVEGACAPRLGCAEDTRAGFPLGCRFPADLDAPERLRRCEPVITEQLAAVRCEPGIATRTSTRPPSLETCACPDGLHCVAWRGGPAAALDLRFLPSGGALWPDEVPEGRICARACSEEGNCPVGHTCRPALVERGGPRDTLAVCYPDKLAATSTTTLPPRPVAEGCLRRQDCAGGLVCRYDVETVPDHPARPLGEAWDHRALVGRCGEETGRADGRSCTRGNECASGVCARARCRIPCDPAFPAESCDRRNCVAVVAERFTAGGPVLDEVSVCDM